jgi:hypothetical protein
MPVSTAYPSLPSQLASAQGYAAAFRQGLEEMLAAHVDAGVYILALANAAYEPELWSHFQAPLAARHAQLADEVTGTLRQGRRPPAPEDDLLVLLQLMALGFEHVAQRQTRAAGPWEVQFNPVRALRPPRVSGAATQGLSAPYDAAAFHFNKPFLAREMFWSGELLGRPVDLLYNKFPFARRHGLLVPERRLELPQRLTPAMHGWAWQLMEALGEALPDIGLAYNSYGAHASVNHLHFQLFERAEPLPAEHAGFAHNGGAEAYPADCQASTDALDAWLGIDALHARQCPYNLIYRPGRMLLLARRAQGDYDLPAWSSGLAWYEMAGGASVFSRDDYNHLDAAAIADALAATRPALPGP